jgi:hypothetical protein
MRTINKIIVVVITTCFVVVSLDAQTRGFDPSGNCHPVKPSNSKADRFIQINLRFGKENGRRVARGEVSNVGRWYKFRTVDVNERGFRFLTTKVDGIRYEFAGSFLGKGNFAQQWSGSGLTMLNGSLRKYVRGVQVLSFDSEFVYYPLH